MDGALFNHLAQKELLFLSLCLQMFTWKMPFTAKLLLALLILLGSANVFGKPRLTNILYQGLTGIRRAKCQVNIFSKKL